MIRYSRRALLKAGTALAGASAIGFPSIVSGQTEKIKIGHLTPLTGFLGALGAYAQLGIRMAEAEINQAGGVMGRQLDITSEDSVNPATAATKATQRMLDQDGVAVSGSRVRMVASRGAISLERRPRR
jgi:branched-chain amino acid transport system substrate-binding protein